MITNRKNNMHLQYVDQMPEYLREYFSKLHYLDDNAWQQLEEWSNNLQTDFMKSFRKDYPFLSKEDYRVIMLIRIGLTHNHIAKIENISLKSLRMRRYRIKQKMQIDCSHLTLFLVNLYK